jgi:hypothetical protein
MPLTRSDGASQVDPQKPVWLSNHSAQLGLLPSRWNAVEASAMATIGTEQLELGEQQAGTVPEKMRILVLADDVHGIRGRHVLRPLNGTIDDLSAQ